MRNDTIYIESIELTAMKKTNNAALCCAVLSTVEVAKDIIKYLCPEEHRYWKSLKNEKQLNNYLIGRLVGKQAVAKLTQQKYFSNIFIGSGIFHQPIVVSDKQNIQVSITHCNHIGAAIAFSEACPMGIDIENIDVCKSKILEKQMTDNEMQQIRSILLSDQIGLTLLWTVKEAISKILKTGLTTPFFIFEISDIKMDDQCIRCNYKNFAQYQSVSFIFHHYVCSVAYPINMNLSFDIKSFLKFMQQHSNVI